MFLFFFLKCVVIFVFVLLFFLPDRGIVSVFVCLLRLSRIF